MNSASSLFGELQIASSDMAYPLVKCDRLALDGAGRLLFASVLADSGIVKGIRALLNCDKRVTISGRGMKVRKASANEYAARTPDQIMRGEGGYTTLVHRLPYGVTHAFYMLKSPGFMPALSDDHLWAALMQPTYTTPLLRDWVPYIRKSLMAKGLLNEGACYRCECALLTATTADLDKVVTEGIAAFEIRVPNRPDAKAAVA